MLAVVDAALLAAGDVLVAAEVSVTVRASWCWAGVVSSVDDVVGAVELEVFDVEVVLVEVGVVEPMADVVGVVDSVVECVAVEPVVVVAVTWD